MAQFYRYPASGGSSVNASVGPIASPIPSDATLVGFEDPSGDLQAGQVNAAGEILTASSAPSGRSAVTTSVNDYGSTNVTTGAWVQLVASLPSAVNQLQVYDTSGEVMEIGIGAAAFETRLFVVPQGGNGEVNVSIPAATRISIRAISANATTASTYNIINFFS